MAENFAVSATEHERRAVVRVIGELDLATTPLLDDAVGLLLATSHAARIEFDLIRLGFCGSAGVRLLVRLSDAARDAGMRVTLRGARPNVRRVFEICGHGHYLEGPLDPTPAAVELVATG